MTDQDILDDAPEDSAIVFNTLLIDKSLIESMGKTLRLMQPRSLTDIRRIVELEKDRDIRDLEQQAKGLADYVSKVMDSSYILHLDPKNTNHCILINLNAAALRLFEKSKALKEQVKL